MFNENMTLSKGVRLITGVIACMTLVIGLTACAGKTSNEGNENSSQTVDNSIENHKTPAADVTEPDKTEPDKTGTEVVETENKIIDTNTGDTDKIADQDQNGTGKDTLVVVFSATGTTKGVAEKIAAITDADFYEIIPAEPYSDADLNWNDNSSRTTKEQNDDSARPAIGSEKISLEGYKTIYIGYPIWWAIEPRIMDTFVESYNFDGITMIPFCTSGSSGIGRSGKNLEKNAGSGNWLDGARFKGNISEADLQKWIDGLQ